MSGMDIQQFNFDTDIRYVLINIAVGKRPPSVVAKKLKMFRQESQLCKVLEELDIPCDIMPAYVDAFNDGSAVQISHSEINEAVECAVDDVRCEAMSAVEELRDELELGELKESPTTNFGFAQNVYSVGQCKNEVLDLSQATMASKAIGRGAEPKFKARSLTTNEMDDQMKALDDIINHPFD